MYFSVYFILWLHCTLYSAWLMVHSISGIHQYGRVLLIVQERNFTVNNDYKFLSSTKSWRRESSYTCSRPSFGSYSWTCGSNNTCTAHAILINSRPRPLYDSSHRSQRAVNQAISFVTFYGISVVYKLGYNLQSSNYLLKTSINIWNPCQL